MYTSNPGATPKLRKSERESSCAPRSDSLRRCLASNPSKTSQIPANKIQTIAKLKSASRANLIELKPKLSPVRGNNVWKKNLKIYFFHLT